MQVFTYSQARQALATVLNTARSERVLITRRGGETFEVTLRPAPKSPFDVPGVTTRAATRDILAAIRESRSRESEQDASPVDKASQ
ncbi:MAG: prevent-host-death protein [Desulfovibrionales bacterium]|nr:MAG: prevent-host-death protein [Desulfovibrionales bacterium]